MKVLTEIDENFLSNSTTIPNDVVFYNPQQPPFQIYGTVKNKEHSYCRLPLDLLPQCPERLQALSYHLSGACIRFSTNSSYLSIIWELQNSSCMGHFSASGQSGMELFEETAHGIIQVKNLIPEMASNGCKRHQQTLIRLDGTFHHYALYLPLYNGLQQLLIGISSDAHLQEGRIPTLSKPLVFYGSSITQGACASKCGSSYTSILSRKFDAAQINLGFSGNAKGDRIIADYIAGLDMSAFIFDYDYNAPDAEFLQNTHKPFFNIVRNANPQLPIVLISRPSTSSLHSHSCKNVILQTFQNAVATGDPFVYFIDGETLFGTTDRELCTVDGIHPNDLGFWRMANAIAPVLQHALVSTKQIH